ncbi:leukotoxin LktA family filamentous adhesin [Anaerovibrio lipolyticus]|uniref:leukotoxin LktA family filamentous adhesin n=1 Tax=Anaerovibrio lipolyticus TaxID=82374 RepID=UPI0023F17B13|nr:leukotoxin LktA family filamentous adhesin [Anaerovibrio lipolyticus]
MSQSGKYRKMMRKHAAEHDQKQDRYAYNILASKIVLGLALGCLSVFPSGIAYADEVPAETEIKTKITAISGQEATIVKEDDLYKIYAQFVSDGLGVNRFKEFSLGNGDRADMYFNMKDSTNYANTLVNMVNSEVNINGVLNAVKDGKIDGNLYFLSPDGIVVGSQGVINAGSFTGMVVQKDAFKELYNGRENLNKSGEEFGLDEITALMASDEDSKPATTGNIEVSGHINTHSGIVLGAGVIDINDGAQLKSISNIQFEDVVSSEIAQQIPKGLTASQRADGSGDIVLKAASFKNVDDSELPALKATKVKDKDEYELKNWDKWGEVWLKELFAADNTSSVTNKGKITTDGAVKISADANTSYKEGQIFEYLQDQRTKDLVQKKIRESIIKDAALRYGMYLYLKKTSGKDSADLLKPDSSQWTKWIDLFLLGIMEGTGNRTNEASVSLGGTIEAESLDAKASANLTMDVNSSVMARAYTNVTGKNTSEVTVNKGLELKQGAEKIDAVTLAADTNTTILATAKGLNVQRKEGDTTTKLPSVYGAVTIVNSESSANVKVNEEIDTAGEFKATASMQEDMEVTASSAMNEESGVLSAGVAYVNDKTSAKVTINKDISASSIDVSANNTVAKDLMTVNNTLGVMSGQIFDGDTQPVELKPLDSSQKSSLNKFFDKLVDYGDELVGKLKKYGDAGATVGIFNQENSSSVEINAALEAINGNEENGDNKGNININAETMIGGTDDDGNQIGGFHMNVVNSMTHAKSSDGSAATTGALINAAVLVDNVKNNATVKIANAKESNENDDDANDEIDEIDEIGENPVASLYASGSININAQAHMDYNPAAEGLYNVKEAWKQVQESYVAITDLPQDIKDAYKAALENWDENVKAIDWSDPTKIPSTISNWEKLKEAIDKVKEDGKLGLEIKERLISTAENALKLTHPSTYTHYHVRTESKNKSEDGSGNFTATGSVQVNELQNNAAVLIGEETSINADGNTGIKAESGTYTVTLTGKGGEYGTLDQSGKVGMGASVAHQEMSGTGLVMVGKKAIIEGNAIDINGVNNMKQVDIVYSSGKADTLNIGGMVNIVKGTGNSIVSIDDEATLTATGKPDGSDEGSNNGTINLHTENNTTINAITGGLTLGGQDAVGAVGIGVNYVDYNTNNIVQVADNGDGIKKASDKADDTEENKAENRTTNRSVLARELAEKLGSVDDDFFGAATDFEAPIDAEDEILWQANKLDVTATTTGTINSIGAEIAGTAGSDRTLFDKGSDLIQKLANKRDKFDNWLKGSKLTDTVSGSNESNKEADDKNLGGKGGFRLSAAGSAAINKGISDTAATVDGINIEKNEAANSSLTEVTVSATDNTFLGSLRKTKVLQLLLVELWAM